MFKLLLITTVILNGEYPNTTTFYNLSSEQCERLGQERKALLEDQFSKIRKRDKSQQSSIRYKAHFECVQMRADEIEKFKDATPGAGAINDAFSRKPSRRQQESI